MGNKISKKINKIEQNYIFQLNINNNNKQLIAKCTDIKIHDNKTYIYFTLKSINMTSLLNKNITVSFAQQNKSTSIEITDIIIQAYSNKLIKINGKNKYQLEYNTSQNNTMFFRYNNIRKSPIEVVYIL